MTQPGNRAIGQSGSRELPGSPGADPRLPANNPALRRRNSFTALALVFLTIPLIPVVQEERIGWFMWRDAPILALTFLALAVIMIIGWRRARNPGSEETKK
jgi:hypothetical protein